MTKRKLASAREQRQSVEFRIDPESEKWLKERVATPEGKEALMRLVDIIAQAVADDMLKEVADGTPGGVAATESFGDET
jgi:hypothetical protein